MAPSELLLVRNVWSDSEEFVDYAERFGPGDGYCGINGAPPKYYLYNRLLSPDECA